MLEDKYTVRWEYTFPSGQSIEIVAQATDIIGYQPTDLTLEFYNLDGVKIDVLYDEDVFLEIEIEATDYLYHMKESLDPVQTYMHSYNYND